MIEATTCDNKGNVSEEMLCRTFLEKLSPNLQFLTRTLTGPNRTNFDTLLLNAQEAELMLCANSNTMLSPLCLINAQSTSLKANTNDESNENSCNKTLWGSRKLKGETIKQYNNKPICNYCDKVGHFEINCRKRQNQEE
nr:unnamed protein product [Meloidogyne enterolobii]